MTYASSAQSSFLSCIKVSDIHNVVVSKALYISAFLFPTIITFQKTITVHFVFHPILVFHIPHVRKPQKTDNKTIVLICMSGSSKHRGNRQNIVVQEHLYHQKMPDFVVIYYCHLILCYIIHISVHHRPTFHCFNFSLNLKWLIQYYAEVRQVTNCRQLAE